MSDSDSLVTHKFPLLCCPHCGGSGRMFCDDLVDFMYYVKCNICGAQGGKDSSEQIAAEKWNLRR